MNITKKQCEEFKLNSKTNTITGITIHIGKIYYFFLFLLSFFLPPAAGAALVY
jgi:hypothetical protein